MVPCFLFHRAHDLCLNLSFLKAKIHMFSCLHLHSVDLRFGRPLADGDLLKDGFTVQCTAGSKFRSKCSVPCAVPRPAHVERLAERAEQVEAPCGSS